MVVATVHMLGLKSTDRLYNSLPLYHTAGGVVGTGAALVDGIPSVLRSKFSASNYWTDCLKFECTVSGLEGVLLLVSLFWREVSSCVLESLNPSS